jgi:hypothetical protein
LEKHVGFFFLREIFLLLFFWLPVGLPFLFFGSDVAPVGFLMFFAGTKRIPAASILMRQE